MVPGKGSGEVVLMTEEPSKPSEYRCCEKDHKPVCGHFRYSGYFPVDEERCDSPIKQDYGCTCSGELIKLTEQQMTLTSRCGCLAHSAIAARRKGGNFPQKPGDPHPRTKYIAYEGELEHLLELGENYPTDEIELDARDTIIFIQDLQRIKEHDAAIREDERKRVCGLVRCLIEHAGYSCGETDHILEYLNEIGPTAPAPGNRTEPEKEKGYRCGDECHGECSGEYDGRIHCPVSEAEQRIADVIAELERRCDGAGDAGDYVAQSLYSEAISLLKNGVKKDGA